MFFVVGAINIDETRYTISFQNKIKWLRLQNVQYSWVSVGKKN